MRMRVSFTREFTLAAIGGAARYYGAAAAGLCGAKAEDLERIEEEIGAMRLDAQREEVERDLLMQEHTGTFDMLMPNFFRYSYVVLLFLIVEDRLFRIAKAASAVRRVSPPVRPSRDVVTKYSQYFAKEVGISAVPWDPLHDLQKVRNCIVHASGRVKESRDEPHLRALARTGIGVQISDRRHATQGDTLPLYLEDGMLILDSEYCGRVTDSVRGFFRQLCDAVPLPRLTIDGQEV